MSNDSNSQASQTGAPSPATQRVAKPGVSGRVDDEKWSTIMNEWLNNNMRNSPVANNADSWNHLVSQLDALRKIVEKHL